MNLRKSLDRGDIVYMDYERPAMVISPSSFNGAGELIFVCPITSTILGSPWEVVLPPEMKITGVVRVDHLKSVDKSRCEKHHHRVIVKEKAPKVVIDEVIAKLETLVT